MQDEEPSPIREAWEALGLVLGVMVLLIFLFGLFMELLESLGIKF